MPRDSATGKALVAMVTPIEIMLFFADRYAALAPHQQLKVFEPAPPNTRKVILATNIAETSITINGVVYVVDTGMVKARTFDSRIGLDQLAVTPGKAKAIASVEVQRQADQLARSSLVSKAQARQRSGRAGREAPGKCFRLYKEQSFLDLQVHFSELSFG